MQPDEAEGKLEDWKWNREHNAGTALCPLRNGTPHRVAISHVKMMCLGTPRCTSEALQAWADSAVGTEIREDDPASSPSPQLPATSKTDADQPPIEPDLTSFHLRLHELAKDLLDKAENPALLSATDRDELIESTVVSFRRAIQEKNSYLLGVIPEQSETDREEDLYSIARSRVDAFQKKYKSVRELPAVQDAREVPDVISIDWEDHAHALVANQEYLTHLPVIEGLCYAKTASLLVGGKHSGKTTNARTISMSVCRGLPIFGRSTMRGPVLYCASEDEVLVVRAELLRMGWNADDPLNLMKIGSKTLADPDRLLDAIAMYATQKRALLIVLDMLFDFAGIKDEMSYAGTREAAGKVYDLAMRTDAHVMATHHSPKYMSGGATAETAALGSQGIAARFSPIILSRHWGGDLYTIESTPPRDPRGKALDAVCVTLDENGMSRAGEPFADSMRWRVMAPKVLDFIKSVDPGQHHTVSALAEGMEINRPMMQTILFNLCREGKLHREKKGRSYKYFLPQEQSDIWQNQN